MIEIRPYKDSDWPDVWHILGPVFYAGETYAFPHDIPEEEAYKA